ncbi:MAG: CDP-alcohol phosphatidyltransferase family protein [Gemmatimonadales bacterium]|nr:CDP-alcohol phosphatidyltransferase family protein [Gemmatimonadales bacterium]
MKVLEPLQRPFYAVIRPLVGWLLKSGVHPNTITTFGAALVIASGAAYGIGDFRYGGLLLLLSGLVDTLDGQVAREGRKTSAFGAFYDSTLDRVGDGASFIGIGAWLLWAPDVQWRFQAVVLAMVTILLSLLVSYTRARAEGLGIDCKVGIAQRAERIVGLGLLTLVFGPGPRGLVVTGVMALLSLLSFITVIQRFHHVYRTTRHRAPDDLPVVKPTSRGDARRALDPVAKRT